MLYHLQFHFMFNESASLDSVQIFLTSFFAYINYKLNKFIKVFLRLYHIHSLILLKRFLGSDLSMSMFFHKELFFLLWGVRVIFFWKFLQASLPRILFQASDTHFASFDASAFQKMTMDIFKIIIFPQLLLQWFVGWNAEVF